MLWLVQTPFPGPLLLASLRCEWWLVWVLHGWADECSLCNTLAYKFGYGTDIEKFKKEASDKFSLLKDGTLDLPRCARLFLVNVRFPPLAPCSFIPTPLSPSL